MTAIRIHGVPPSTFTRTVRLACHEKGIDYELVPTMPSEITRAQPVPQDPGDHPWRSRALRVDGDPALSRSHASRAETVAGGSRPASRSATNGSAPSAIRWSTPRCATWPRATASCRCRPRCGSNISTRRARSCRSSTASSARPAILRATRMTAADLFLAPVLFYFPDIRRAPGDRRLSTQLRALGARHGRPRRA